MGPEHKRPGEFADRTGAPTSTTLGGRRLFVVRVVWLTVSMLSVGLFLASIPAYYTEIVTFSDREFKSAVVRASLEASGVSVRFYAICLLSISLASTVVWVAVAMVIFWRRADNWMALFASLSLITFATLSLPSSPPALADQYFALWLPTRLLGLFGAVSLYTFYLLFPT